MERLIGIVLTQMSGMGARIGGHDLQLRRRVDEIVYETRVKLAIPSISSRTRPGNRR